MKITTVRQGFGKDVNISIDDKPIKLKFSPSGECEIKKELADKVLAKYPQLFFNPEVEANKEVKVKIPAHQENLIRNLESKIVDLNSEITSLRKDKGTIEADKNEWAKVATEAQAKVDAANKEVENIKTVMESMKTSYELKISLLESKVPALEDLCERSNYPKEEWKDLRREDLIEYILEKSK